LSKNIPLVLILSKLFVIKQIMGTTYVEEENSPSSTSSLCREWESHEDEDFGEDMEWEDDEDEGEDECEHDIFPKVIFLFFFNPIFSS
jgi:hypothetical protein